MTRVAAVSVRLCSALALCAAFASAEVTQPDGQVMPIDANNGEVTLQQLFDFREGAGAIDAKADAATEPSTFKPLCDFSAQLLLHETRGNAGVGWYNSPATDTPPSAVCDESTDMNSEGKPCTEGDIFLLIPGNVTKPPFSGDGSDPLQNPGQVFTGADLAKSKYYKGGDIGFALLTGQKHYSERRLNPMCTGDNCIVPGNWIPTIMYASKKTPRGYYMCSEDQDILSDRWGNNDGDFQDFVFLFTGLVCSGSGEPCDTGEPGICAAGLTDCADSSGESACRPARTPGKEKCNGLDDDCDGDMDEGDLCPEGELCVKARCVPKCGVGEFRCDLQHQCVDGACVEKSCVDVECKAGKVCHSGKCVGPCDDVTCPTGQACADGVCVDPCDGIDCGKGFVCEGGACLVECSCAGCAKGECNAKTGHCVDDGCGNVSCDAGKHCVASKCVDDCEDAACPGGAACESGACLPPATGNEGETGAGGAGSDDPGLHFGGDGSFDPGSGTGNTGNGTGNKTGTGEAGETSGSTGGKGNSLEAKSGCACDVVGSSSTGRGALAAALAGLLLLGRRRSRNAHSQ